MKSEKEIRAMLKQVPKDMKYCFQGSEAFFIKKGIIKGLKWVLDE